MEAKNSQRQYVAIDLKSFYASVECVERGLDPLDALLVVADASRTNKTICLAVSPALKEYGTGGRPRLFEVVSKVKEANMRRGRWGMANSKKLLDARPELAVDYIVAPPRMSLYMKYSAKIYSIYLRFVAPEDVHVYSVDEVFIDVTPYLATYRMTAHELAMKMIRAVLAETGITATAGIGTNMYLCKVAMDIVAKHMAPDAQGVRIAELDEMSYRRTLWSHTPLTDFWRVGAGIATRLAAYGIHTMGDIARCSLEREGLLYRLFGVNAELLIDHAWGWEPVDMAHVKAYRPATHSLSSGQVLHRPYSAAEARNVMLEMADNIALKLTDKGLMTNLIEVTVSYDHLSLADPAVKDAYTGKIVTDHYGRRKPAHSHGTAHPETYTCSSEEIVGIVAGVYDRIIDRSLLVRRLNVSVCNLLRASDVASRQRVVQLSLFADCDETLRELHAHREMLHKENCRQQAVLHIKKRYGKNAILKGLNYAEGATQRDRNQQIGGHHE